MSKPSVIGFLALANILLLCTSFQSASSRAPNRRKCGVNQYFDKIIRECRSCLECCPPRSANFLCVKECNLETFCSGVGQSQTTAPEVNIDIVETDNGGKVLVIVMIVAAVALVTFVIVAGGIYAAKNDYFSFCRHKHRAVEVTSQVEENGRAYNNDQAVSTNNSQSSNMGESLKQPFIRKDVMPVKNGLV